MYQFLRRPLLAMAALLLVTGPLSAQIPPELVQRARAGNWYLRVGTSTQDTIEGRITSTPKDSVRLGRTMVALADVLTAERRLRQGGGALPAGLFGAAIVGALGLSLAGLCEGDCSSAAVAGALGGAAMGLTAGTSIGALVAPGRIVWRRIHPPGDSAIHVIPPVAAPDTTAAPDFAGGGVTVSAGAGLLMSDYSERVMRLSLQLGGTRAARRPVETTAEFQLLLAPQGEAALLGVAAGANIMSRRGAYAGPFVGITTAGDEALFSLGARAGLRPARSGVRPELRGELFLIEGAAVMLMASLGLEIH